MLNGTGLFSCRGTGARHVRDKAYALKNQSCDGPVTASCLQNS
ncbi:MAG: hypothetical protein QXP99_00380 [Thermoproteota archaeon]